MDQWQAEYERSVEIRVLAQRMEEADYPVRFGSCGALNETAAAYLRFDALTQDHRARLTEADGSAGRTFRDYRSDGEGGEGGEEGDDAFRSVFTHTVAVPLRQRWLDIDAQYSTVLEP
mmetsp:Transcript_34632/g.68181  ORF Transcript_34632/g.68181 Transcript_34632/m.68181 type:complete len:118 (+) Transcript_34632:1-354(+)